MIIGKNYRITVLTDYLIRLEYSQEGEFVDLPTQIVTGRDMGEVRYKQKEADGKLVVETSKLILTYDQKEFTGPGLSIELKDVGTVWHYSHVYGNSDGNLWGTGRTLDNADGWIQLENGIFGRFGYAVLDDSFSALYKDGEFIERPGNGTDIYFFGYGREYRKGLKDFFSLCGKTPMVPRYALGNWWSRYHRYSEESYNELLDRMEKEQIPLSVAVIDMDWHITDVDPKYGTGWTGYTWNKDLFPNYKRFLKGLKKRKLATTLNLHPADGVRAFEAQYPAMAKRLGIDPSTEKVVEFDLSQKDLRDAYFEEVMNPYEKDGVDFWWIDWQQGTRNGNTTVDPLFLLNHYHYEDRKKAGNRPMIFSRYAGPGSHRYPVGFSGDTHSTWKSLAFQPYFTSTATNIGYGWWSHDIGGHMLGDKDEDRLIRWIQFGVFSPIMRLHSSNSPFFNKEPWNVSQPYHDIMVNFMQLRHRLLPYLYTANYRAYDEGRMLIEPMYYGYADEDAAYQVPNEYLFGTELIVGAITEKTDPVLRLGRVNMFIPEGRFYDIFTGMIYDGAQRRNIYRKISEIPVLLKAGGIVPMSLEDTQNGTDNPKSFRLLVGAGADGSYEMYEDDGISEDYKEGKGAFTAFATKYDKKSLRLKITISPARGELANIPDERGYEVVIYGIDAGGKESLKAAYVSDAGHKKQLVIGYDTDRHTATIILPKTDVTKGQSIVLEGFVPAENDHVKKAFEILELCWCDTLVKERVYDAVRSKTREDFRKWLYETDISDRLKDALTEVL